LIITLKRIQSDELATTGYLSIDGTTKCFTIEDAFHVGKIQGKTRIPSGTYDIKLRNEGRLTQKYAQKFDFHKGMLWLQDVPNFEWIYIHIGNVADHTDGCILTGMSAYMADGIKNVGHSIDAYKSIYSEIAEAILSGEKVSINILDEQE